MYGEPHGDAGGSECGQCDERGICECRWDDLADGHGDGDGDADALDPGC